MALVDTMTDSEKLDFLVATVAELKETLDRYKPLLERYEMAARANNFRTARRIMREGSAEDGR